MPAASTQARPTLRGTRSRSSADQDEYDPGGAIRYGAFGDVCAIELVGQKTAITTSPVKKLKLHTPNISPSRIILNA